MTLPQRIELLLVWHARACLCGREHEQRLHQVLLVDALARQAVEPRESSLYLLQRAIRRSDSPAHTLQLLRVRCEGGDLRRAEKRLQLGCDLRREAVGR